MAAMLSAVNLLYHVPKAERVAQNNASRQFAQDMSRLQSTLEYLLLKGEFVIAQHQVSVLAHNHDYRLVILIDDQQKIIASTRRILFGQPVTTSVPNYDSERAAKALHARRAQTALNPAGDLLFGYVGVLLGRRGEELKPSRSGILFLTYDLSRIRSEARAQVLDQSLYWAGWVTALALAIWLVLHFLLTRRTALLVRTAERLASGDLDARSALRGRDELGRLSRAFDAMAAQISRTQTQLKNDIEERARMLRALENSEAQYRSMFNASIDGLMLWSADRVLVDINPALWRMYGYTREDFVALAPSKFIGPTSGAELLRPVDDGQALHIDISDTRKDGSALELEVHAVPMQYQGKPHVLAIARDVTEKKQSTEHMARQREALHQQEKLAALGSLLAGVSHELNNPLSVVVGRSVMLEEQVDSRTRAALAKIRAAAERCARIVRTFLAMARQQRPERSTTLVNEIISAVLDITGYTLRTSGIEVTLNLAEEAPSILADADQLHQVMSNLIINAQQALQEHPAPRRIVLSSYYDRTDELIRITVADNGPGIPADIIGRVFEPYFTTKPVGAGLGAGLAVSLGIIEAHGGTLTVECPENAGTIFTIKLPAMSPESRRRDADIEAEECRRQLSVLVIDDEEDIRETLAEILESKEYRVTLAASGRKALEWIEASPFDVILLDIRMPDRDGLSLHEEIQRRWPDQSSRVIFVTGDTLTPSLAEWAGQRGCPVIEKPFLPSEVHRFVAELGCRP
ncbi:MAG: response regulator [Candidatus Competibacteraceae bacterium]|nr:response regulator [Candidatus Competibacteraceae bacterium]